MLPIGPQHKAHKQALRQAFLFSGSAALDA